MPDQPEAVAPIVETPKPPDPYDLGDTELYPRQEAAPYVPGTTPPAGAIVTGEAKVASPAAPPTLPRDPATGRFVPAIPAAEPVSHPDWLIRQATDFGFSQPDIEAMPTDALGRAVAQIFKNREAFRTRQAAERTHADAEVRAPGPTPPQTPSEAEVDLDENEFDPRLVSAFRKLRDDNKSLREQLGGVVQRDQEREATRTSDQIDQAFGSLGEGFKNLLGDKPAAELSKEELARRVAILNLAKVDMRKLLAAAALKAQIKAAAELLYPQTAAAAAEPENPYATPGAGKPRISKEQWQEAGLARPTQRRGSPEPNGDAKAVKNLEQRMRESGLSEPDADVMDGLLPGE